MPTVITNELLSKNELVYHDGPCLTLDQCSENIRNSFSICQPSLAFHTVYTLRDTTPQKWTSFIRVPLNNVVTIDNLEYRNVIVALGVFDSEEDAAYAYNIAIIRLSMLLQIHEATVCSSFSQRNISITEAGLQKIKKYIEEAYVAIKEFQLKLMEINSTSVEADSFSFEIAFQTFDKIIDLPTTSEPMDSVPEVFDLIVDNQQAINNSAIFSGGKFHNITSYAELDDSYRQANISTRCRGVWSTSSKRLDGSWKVIIRCKIANDSRDMLIPLPMNFTSEDSALMAHNFGIAVLNLLLEKGKSGSAAEIIANKEFEKYTIPAYFQKIEIFNFLKSVQKKLMLIEHRNAVLLKSSGDLGNITKRRKMTCQA